MNDRRAYAEIVRRLNPSAELVRFRPLDGGVSAITTALELRHEDGELFQLVVRQQDPKDWKPHQANVTATGFRLLEALLDLDMPVPRVLMLDESGELLPAPFLIMEFVEGTTSVSETELATALPQMAAFLAELHHLEPQSLKRGNAAPPELPELEDPIEALPGYLESGPFADRLLTVLPSTLPERGQSAPSVLHGDYWPGNILWQNGRLAAVLDWEDASIGDPLSDVAACRVELLCEHGADAMEIFTRHYLEASGADTRNLPIWELYVSASALATMGQWGLDPGDEARRRTATSQFMKRAAEELLADHR